MMHIWVFAILIGCGAGVLVPSGWWLLRQSSDWMYDSVGYLQRGTSLTYAVLLPGTAAALIFLLFALFRAYRSADGFTYLISDLHFQDGRRKLRYSFLHGFGALILLFGQAVIGIEGFAIEVLSALGSRMAQIAKLSTNQVRTLSACGAAASLAAMLGQPTAAFLFVVELLYGWGNFSFAVGPYAVSAFAAASVAQSMTSPAGIFRGLFASDAGLSLTLRSESFGLSLMAAVFCVVIVGSTAALLAAFTIWVHRKTDQELHSFFETRRATDISRFAFLVRLAIWGTLTACVIYVFPEALGSGVGLLHDTLSQEYLLSIALAALLLRVLMGAISYSVIGSIGLIFPVLVTGGVLGACIALASASALQVSAGTLALLAMGAYFSAAFGTPVAATALVFGYSTGFMSESAVFLFTALATNFVAHALCGSLQADRMASMGLYRHGIRFRSGMCFNTLSGIQVRDAMITYISPVPVKSSIGEAYKRLMESKFSVRAHW